MAVSAKEIVRLLKVTAAKCDQIDIALDPEKCLKYSKWVIIIIAITIISKAFLCLYLSYVIMSELDYLNNFIILNTNCV